MLELILLYLIQNKRIALPGIGLLFIEEKPGRYDYTEKIMRAPTTQYVLHANSNKQNPADFDQYLAEAWNISAEKAKAQWDLFFQQQNDILQQQKTLKWNGIGQFFLGDGGISFLSGFDSKDYFPDIPAVQVIRDNPDMKIRVGEDERTKTQMEAHFAHKKKKIAWWVYLLIVLGVLVMAAAIGYFFYFQKR